MPRPPLGETTISSWEVKRPSENSITITQTLHGKAAQIIVLQPEQIPNLVHALTKISKETGLNLALGKRPF